jgi:hypothetical protein
MFRRSRIVTFSIRAGGWGVRATRSAVHPPQLISPCLDVFLRRDRAWSVSCGGSRIADVRRCVRVSSELTLSVSPTFRACLMFRVVVADRCARSRQYKCVSVSCFMCKVHCTSIIVRLAPRQNPLARIHPPADQRSRGGSSPAPVFVSRRSRGRRPLFPRSAREEKKLSRRPRRHLKDDLPPT